MKSCRFDKTVCAGVPQGNDAYPAGILRAVTVSSIRRSLWFMQPRASGIRNSWPA